MNKYQFFKVWFSCCVLFPIFGIACAPHNQKLGQSGKIIKEYFSHESETIAHVLLLDGPKWLDMKDEFAAILLRSGAISEALREESTAKNDGGVPVCRDICLILINGRRTSLIISFGQYGFAVGYDRTHRFTNPELSQILRDLFESEGMIKGYKGHCLDHALKIAAGDKNVPELLKPTQKELEVMAEERGKKRQRLTYKMKSGDYNTIEDDAPSEAKVFSETQTFLATGKDVNKFIRKEETHMTRLHLAVNRGHWAVVKLLLIHGADPNIADSDGWAPLQTAAHLGMAEIASFLIIKGADPNGKKTLEVDETPLHMAVSLDHQLNCPNDYDLVKLLVAAGAKIDAKDDSGCTPLMNTECLRIAKFLCDNGANINAKNKDGETVLYQHVCSHPAIAKYLISKNASIDFFSAIYLDMTDYAKKLLNHNPALARSTDGAKKTALHLAADKGNNTIIELLHAIGTNINAKDFWGNTPLFYAVRSNLISSVKLLVLKGADVNMINVDKKTPLDEAVKLGYTNCIKFLRKHGAKSAKQVVSAENSGATGKFR